MHPNAPVIRSVLGRSVAEVSRSRQSLRLCRRTFSTTQLRPAEEPKGPKDEQRKPKEHSKPKGPPSSRQERSAAAASELGALNKPSPASQGAASGASNFKKPSFDKGNNKIISFRSLPRKEGDGTGPRFFKRPPAAEGGDKPAGDGTQKYTPRQFSGGPANGAGPRARPPFRPRTPGGRPGAGGRPGGKGKFRRAGGKKKKKDGNEDGEGDDYIYSIEEKLWLEAHEQGVQMTYKPSLTKESLLGYGPAVVSTSPVSKVETALRNMRILSGGAPFDSSRLYTQPEEISKQIRRNKPVFFSDVKEREWHKESEDGTKEFTAVHDETKKAILQAAIQGKHVAPTFATSKDIHGTLAMYHARDSTYQAGDGRKLDAKVLALLPLAKDSKAPPKAAKAAKA